MVRFYADAERGAGERGGDVGWGWQVDGDRGVCFGGVRRAGGYVEEIFCIWGQGGRGGG